MSHLPEGTEDSRPNEPARRQQSSDLMHLVRPILGGLVMVAVLAVSLSVILGVLFGDWRSALYAAGLVFVVALGVAPTIIVDHVQQEKERISGEDD